jgi:hypothetical protein
VPSYQYVEKVARRMELDPATARRLFEAARYLPPFLESTPPAEETYAQAYQRAMREIEAELAEAGIIDLPETSLAMGGTQGLTAEDAEREAKAFRDAILRRFGKGA